MKDAQHSCIGYFIEVTNHFNICHWMVPTEFAVLSDTVKGPVTIVNVYMPCKSLKLSDELSCETLDGLSEIIEKYSTSSNIILVGDLNASLHRDQPLARD